MTRLLRVVAVALLATVACATGGPASASGWHSNQHYTIGAYYFSGWEPDAVFPALQQTITHNVNAGDYQQADLASPWWAGVRDFADPPVTPFAYGTGDKFTGREPAQGYYDDRDPNVLQTQIAQAQAGGLSYFDFYWYWDGSTGTEALAGAIHAFEAAEAAHPSDTLRFTLSMFESGDPNYGLTLPVLQYPAAVAMLARYMADPHYLRVNGRPLFSVMDVTGLAGSPDAFVGVLDAATPVRPFVLANLGLPMASADGRTCFNVGVQEGAGPQSYAAQIADIPSGPPGQPFLQCATSDFDERPRTGLYWPASEAGHASYFTETATKAGEFAWFTKAMQQARVNVDRQPIAEPLSRFLTVYAWNEWQEGGVLEPSKADGARYLSILAKEFPQ